MNSWGDAHTSLSSQHGFDISDKFKHCTICLFVAMVRLLQYNLIFIFLWDPLFRLWLLTLGFTSFGWEPVFLNSRWLKRLSISMWCLWLNFYMYWFILVRQRQITLTVAKHVCRLIKTSPTVFGPKPGVEREKLDTIRLGRKSKASKPTTSQRHNHQGPEESSRVVVLEHQMCFGSSPLSSPTNTNCSPFHISGFGSAWFRMCVFLRSSASLPNMVALEGTCWRRCGCKTFKFYKIL